MKDNNNMLQGGKLKPGVLSIMGRLLHKIYPGIGKRYRTGMGIDGTE
jgi:hypothetical protein